MGFRFLTKKLFFWAIMLAPATLESRSHPPRTRIVAYFLKTFESKNGLLVWRPWPGDLGQKCVNSPQLWRHWRKTKIQNFPFFGNVNYKTFRIFRGFEQNIIVLCNVFTHTRKALDFEQLSSSNSWRFLVLQSSTRKVAHAGIKPNERSRFG